MSLCSALKEPGDDDAYHQMLLYICYVILTTWTSLVHSGVSQTVHRKDTTIHVSKNAFQIYIYGNMRL